MVGGGGRQVGQKQIPAPRGKVKKMNFYFFDPLPLF
jgi:hypothetical protein